MKEVKQNFISVDRKTAISSYDETFTVGEIVSHQDTSVGTAKIEGFEPNAIIGEVMVMTSKGYTHVDFLVKTKAADYKGFCRHVEGYYKEGVSLSMSDLNSLSKLYNCPIHREINETTVHSYLKF